MNPGPSDSLVAQRSARPKHTTQWVLRRKLPLNPAYPARSASVGGVASCPPCKKARIESRRWPVASKTSSADNMVIVSASQDGDRFGQWGFEGPAQRHKVLRTVVPKGIRRLIPKMTNRRG